MSETTSNATFRRLAALPIATHVYRCGGQYIILLPHARLLYVQYNTVLALSNGDGIGILRLDTKCICVDQSGKEGYFAGSCKY